MRKRNTITLKWLQKEGACGPAVKAFTKRFGKSAPTGDVLRALYRSKTLALKQQVNWADWILEHCLSPALLDAWSRAWWDAPAHDDAYKRIDLKFINKAWPKGAKP
jgi:hypothetical protein